VIVPVADSNGTSLADAEGMTGMTMTKQRLNSARLVGQLLPLSDHAAAVVTASW
jgi:hypothetical protein